MPFKKGQSGNPEGRPVDKSTAEVRKALRDCAVKNLPKLQKSLDAIAPGYQFIRALDLICKHILPPLANPERPSEELLLQVLEYVKSLKNEEQTVDY